MNEMNFPFMESGEGDFTLQGKIHQFQKMKYFY